MAKFDVSVIGELNLDLIFYGLPQKLELDREHLATNLSLTLGSSSAIFAHNLSRLGSTVNFSSSIGSDSLGPICIERLAEAKIDLTRVRKFDGKITGLTVILPQGKERYILTYPGTMAEYSIADLDLKYVFDAKHLHVASYFLQKAIQPSLEQIFREAKSAGLTTSLDTNDDPDDRWPTDIQKLFPHLDLLMPNEHEACRMARRRRHLRRVRLGRFHGADRHTSQGADQLLRLPLHASLSPADQDRVVDSLRKLVA